MIEATEEYGLAYKLGQKEYKELISADKDPHPAVLDEILEGKNAEQTQEVGLV